MRGKTVSQKIKRGVKQKEKKKEKPFGLRLSWRVAWLLHASCYPWDTAIQAQGYFPALKYCVQEILYLASRLLAQLLGGLRCPVCILLLPITLPMAKGVAAGALWWQEASWTSLLIVHPGHSATG